MEHQSHDDNPELYKRRKESLNKTLATAYFFLIFWEANKFFVFIGLNMRSIWISLLTLGFIIGVVFVMTILTNKLLLSIKPTFDYGYFFHGNAGKESVLLEKIFKYSLIALIVFDVYLFFQITQLT
tara:strand:- start:778 stop:1155 length:378 start_codon:yes stop_codon:yes gene_type:complete